MKNIKNKLLKTTSKVVITAFIALIPFMTNIHAADPKLDEQGTKNLITDWVKPLTNVALWAVPGVTGVILIISGIMWLQKDEEEREQKPWKKQAVKIVKIAVVLELIPTILKLLGL